MYRQTLALLFSCIALTSTYADDNQITINNNAATPPQSQANNNNGCVGNNNQPEGMRPGTYYTSNPNGGTDTVYTTGDKTPYNLNDSNGCDNNNNITTPIIQPYIGPGPRPGPRPIR